jgi:AcrR family transcriptional regulator
MEKTFSKTENHIRQAKSAIRNPKSTIRNPKLRARYDRKLESILRTASGIFAAKGYHPTTMRDISRATGISLAGLYHYCESKDELLFLIQDNCFGRVLERLDQRLKETENANDHLRIFIENHLSFFAANMAEMKVLSHEGESLGGEKHQHVALKKREYTKRVRTILAELQRTTNGKQKVDLTVATYALFGMLNWIYNWYNPKGTLKVNELAQNVTLLFVGGFLSANVSVEWPATVRQEPENMSVWRAGRTKK